MSEVSPKNIFDCAKLQFKIASGAGVFPAEGVAVQIRLNDDKVVIFQESNRHTNAVTKIYGHIHFQNTLSQTFQVEAIVFATEIDIDTGEAMNPCKTSLEALPLLLQEDENNRPSIFMVYGHSADNLVIREYNPIS